MIIDFNAAFFSLTGNKPFPWQESLYRRFAAGEIPESCNLPTGLGKTSVVAIWLIALANHPEKMPRRLVYVVNRRTVVDQTTNEVENLSKYAECAGVPKPAISTLRGQFADNREWSADPSRPAVICGTVDMIGSRLLFSGYGVGFKGKPLHAGFLGQDVLLVHDEAHLEPAFQKLIVDIEKEQRDGERTGDLPWKKLRIMELSATSRGTDAFSLSDADRANPEVKKRVEATKAIRLHSVDDEKRELADKLVELALLHKDSERAILVFVRSVEDVAKVVAKLPKDQWQQLTGTLRGLERDRMSDPRREDGCPIFARFLRPPKQDAPESERWKIVPRPGVVYLVCTSAGEVGVNISADHLVCDLSTFDSMAQRFGRVNRFGERDDSYIDVVCPTNFDEKELNLRRSRTLELLKQLNGNGSPAALGELDLTARLAAFSPPPVILPISDILFDAWGLTTVSENLPGRPPVEPYLHGISDWEPPQSKVAWREEVWELRRKFEDDGERKVFQNYVAELLDDFPLKPHETLADRSDRILNALRELPASPDTPVWIVDNQDAITVTTLYEVINGDKNALNNMTVLLPPEAGGLEKGLLTPSSKTANDVANQWLSENGQPRRARIWDDEDEPSQLRLIRTIDTKPDTEDNDENTTGKRFWRWFEIANEGGKTSKKPVLWDIHVGDVIREATAILANLPLDPQMKEAIIFAARFHDHGKRRRQFQTVLGNFNYPAIVLAKSGKKGGRIAELYRHEFGSLLDIQRETEFNTLKDNPELQDLILHLIAVHHGYGRPHFPEDRAFDPEPKGMNTAEIAAEVPRRFARLQRKYGRWGLAYLESLLRAADWAASAKPSEFVKEDE